MKSLILALAAATILAATASHAQDSWPQRQVTVVAPFNAGGTADIYARFFAKGMQANYGTPFIVENRSGAGGNIGAASVARAPKDGYTLLLGTINIFTINQFIYKNPGYDAEKDFQPISLIAQQPTLLVVNPKIPAKTMAELIAHMKKHPGKLNYGSSGVGTSLHLAAELLQIKTGTKMTHVPYRSSAELMNSVVGGHIDLTFDTITSAWPLARSGAIVPIAVSSRGRSATAPGVASVAETLPGFEATSWHGLFAPAGTPRTVVDKLAAEVKRIFESPEINKYFAELGAVPSPLPPAQFVEFIARERSKWREVVQAAGVPME